MLLRIELPLAWPGIITGLVLAFAHTLGEFGVVLMVHGSMPGQTKTIAISIYDSALLLVLSLAAFGVSFMLSRRVGRRYV